jgi:hypothetical protein
LKSPYQTNIERRGKAKKPKEKKKKKDEFRVCRRRERCIKGVCWTCTNLFLFSSRLAINN